MTLRTNSRKKAQDHACYNNPIVQEILAWKKTIDTFTLNFLNEVAEEFEDQNLSREAFAKLKQFAVAGKTVRGSLFFAAAKAFAKDEKNLKTEDLLYIASSLEIIQSGLLIHDDIIDRDTLRRGQTSIWQQYQIESEIPKFKKVENYGQSLALCLGSICLYLAQMALDRSNLKIEIKNEIKQILNREIIRTYFAEMLDSKIAALKEDPSLAEVLEMYRFKTARYTFSLPLQLAGSINSRTQAEIDSLILVGEKLGLIFQIKDDEIGLFAEEKKSGKSFASDLREGKKTIYYLSLLPKLNPQEKDFFWQNFGQAELSYDSSKKLQDLFAKHALKEVRQVIEKLSDEAQELINQLNFGQDILTEILRFNLERQS